MVLKLINRSRCARNGWGVRRGVGNSIGKCFGGSESDGGGVGNGESRAVGGGVGKGIGVYEGWR